MTAPRRAFGALVMVAVIVAAIVILRREMGHVDIATVRAAMASVSWGRFGVAAGLVAVAYTMLVTYDWLALRLLTRTVPLRTVGLTAFTAFAFSNNLGFAVVTGGSLRYRGYRPFGFSAGDVAVVTIYSHACFFVGSGAVLAGAALVDGPGLGWALNMPSALVWLGGLVAGGLVVAYLALAATIGRPVRVWRVEVPVPPLDIALRQLAASVVDVLVTAGALYVLVPQPFPLGFLTFAGVTIAAIGAGAASHVPGGLGVVEAVLLVAVPGEAKAGLLAAILLFRLLYYLAPLGLATALILTDMATNGRLSLSRARPPG